MLEILCYKTNVTEIITTTEALGKIGGMTASKIKYI